MAYIEINRLLTLKRILLEINAILTFILGLNGVRLIRVNVPSYRFRGEDAKLTCLYDLEGEQLYSVKWYKDGDEFFRFIPGDPDKKVTIFKLPGISVDVCLLPLYKICSNKFSIDK